MSHKLLPEQSSDYVYSVSEAAPVSISMWKTRRGNSYSIRSVKQS